MTKMFVKASGALAETTAVVGSENAKSVEIISKDANVVNNGLMTSETPQCDVSTEDLLTSEPQNLRTSEPSKMPHWDVSTEEVGQSSESQIGGKPFTCLGDNRYSPVVPVSMDEWMKRRQDPALRAVCERIEAGEEKLKDTLPVWTPMCAEFQDNHRLTRKALKPLRRAILDFDQKGHSAEILDRAMALMGMGRWEVLLVEESVRRGTHVVVTIPEGMSVKEVQERFSEDIGFAADPACKDAARCLYLVPDTHVLYMNDRLFEVDNSLWSTDNRQRTTDKSQGSTEQFVPRSTLIVPRSEHQNSVETFPPLKYPDLVAVLEEQMGGAPDHGSRNNFIFSMACHLRYVCNDDPAWIASVLPTYGEEEGKWMSTIKSACNRSQTKAVPRIIKRTLEICRRNADVADMDADIPPVMPANLPPLIKLLTSKSPELYKATVSQSVFPALGAHLCGVRFRYIDNVEHEPLLMHVQMAETGAGKSCVKEPVERIMASIKARDAENQRRENQWKMENRRRGANKDKAKRPDGLIVQCVSSDMTNAAFVNRLKCAEGHTLFTMLDEVDGFNRLRGDSRYNNHFLIMREGYDHAPHGQERVSDESINETAEVRWNWLASTTISTGTRYFAPALTCGTLHRFTFSTIAQQAVGAAMPVYGIYDDAFDEELREYLDNLDEASGLVECPKAKTFMKKMVAECAAKAVEMNSRVYENLSYRALTSAYRKAMILYIAQGMKWDKRIEDFIRWSLHYDLWCKMHFFGDAIAKAISAGTVRPAVARGPKNHLAELPDTFTYEQAVLVHEQNKLSGKPGGMISNWKKRGYIEEVGEKVPQNERMKQQYRKTEKYFEKQKSGDNQEK